MMEELTVTITQEEYELLLENNLRLNMIRTAMKDYMKIWRADSDPDFDKNFNVVLRAVFTYDFEFRLRELRAQKAKEDENK